MRNVAEAGFVTVGQPVAEALARRALASDGKPSTLLVHGPRGAGKGQFVEDLLATVFCTATDRDRRPCNACTGCRQARAGTHPDLVVASPASWRADRGSGESIVAVARRWLLDVAGAPIIGPWRVVVVEHADQCNEQIQNALLKAIEEPAGRQLFLLVAEDARRLLPTIRSRCQALRLGPVPRAALTAWLADSEHLTDEHASALARLADGLSGRAVRLARAPQWVDWRRRTQHELLDLLERGPAERLPAARELIEDAARLSAGPRDDAEDEPPESGGRMPTSTQRAAALEVLEAWVDLARDLAVAAAGAPQLAVAGELVDDLSTVARRLGPRPVAAAAATLDRIRDGVEQNVSPRLALEVAILSWPQLPAGG